MKKIITQIKFTKDRPMYLGWGLLLLLSLFVPAPALADHCTIAGIAIIPGPWESTSEAISLTIQTQDSGGNSCHADATIRLSFNSSDGGEFTNQAGTAVPQAWISTNQSNRNFYYKSGTLATDDVTIEAGYGTADDWVVSFTKTESIADLLDDNTDEDENEDGGSDDDNEGDEDDDDTSSHSSPTPLSTKKVGTKFEVDAGRNRLAVAGGAVKFIAEMSGDSNSRVNYYWSFGDGTSEKGKEVTHVYKYPGHYNVVLNVKGRESDAVARTEVEVITADLKLEIAPDGNQVIVVNETTDEVNIGNFILDYDGQNIFVFSEDTILNPGARLVIDESMSGVSMVNKVILKTIMKDDLAEASLGAVTEVLGTEEKTLLLQELQNEVVYLQNILQARQQVPLIVENDATDPLVIDPLVSTSTETTTNVKMEATTIVLDKPVGFWDKVLVLPNRGFNFLSNIF